jgi:hypothetical protein
LTFQRQSEILEGITHLKSGSVIFFSSQVPNLTSRGLMSAALPHDDEDGPGRPFFYESILRAERQRLLTFYHLIFSVEPGLIASFRGCRRGSDNRSSEADVRGGEASALQYSWSNVSGSMSAALQSSWLP